MDTESFKNHIYGGSDTDYVSTDALQFLSDSASYTIVERSALEKQNVDSTECISISTTGTVPKGQELITRIKELLEDGQRDIQKYQLRCDGKIPNTIEIWRHGSGYSAFAVHR